MNLLLIEDDAVLADGLVHTLGNSGFTLTCATTGKQAEQLVKTQDYELIILDLGLPDMDGLKLLRRLRLRHLPVPILILTARDGINDRVQGIEEGADDYLTKPFELRELEARIHALIRRCYGGFRDDIKIGRLVLNTHEHRILADDQPLILSGREYDVLEILLLQAGKVVCKDRLAHRLASDGDALADNAVEVCIHRVRKRIEPFGAMIRTVRGLGYLLETVID